MLPPPAERLAIDSTTRSAPSNVRACSSIACARLCRKEPIATSAAIPSVIEIEKSKSRRRLERLSRHAIFQMNDRMALMTRPCASLRKRMRALGSDAATSGSCVTSTSAVPALAIQFEHDLDDRLACFRIEISGRFVGEKNLWAD